MARARVIRFGPGSLESVRFSVWAGRGSSLVDGSPSRLVATVSGTCRVFCGNGAEHEAQVSGRADEHAGSPASAPETSWAELAGAWKGDPGRAFGAASELVRACLDESWQDPCEAPEAGL